MNIQVTDPAATAQRTGEPAGEGLLALLETRRSVGMTVLAGPGPSEAELRRLLAIAARVPDHGGLEPWRFIVIEGQARFDAGPHLAALYAAENGDMDPEKRAKFAGIMSRVFTYAPVIVIVVSRSDAAARIPAWEQDLSAGAVCMNLLTAAAALGFGATWLTGWAAYSPGAHRLFGLEAHEKVAGVVHIGTAKETPAERKRPDIAAITTRWQAPEAGPKA
ncbi:nitroreductase family protein [Phreatobacter stygius]|uniref:Putative NAD(P)H nitroreductase n=1 Tax=Phreatobacter stygius TaxID=1940610 RepID=A0A4D7BCB8_9HYPH|nr:nitroreductase [Phreatobacter stygius]QCI68273.1 nitroreductase [Phreatobacter stygius]